MRRIVTAVVAAIALLKKRTIPRMKKEIPFTDHFDRAVVKKAKGPPKRAFFNLSPEPCGLSSPQRAQRKRIGGYSQIA